MLCQDLAQGLIVLSRIHLQLLVKVLTQLKTPTQLRTFSNFFLCSIAFHAAEARLQMNDQTSLEKAFRGTLARRPLSAFPGACETTEDLFHFHTSAIVQKFRII